MTALLAWLRDRAYQVLAWLDVGNFRRRWGGVKAARARKKPLVVTATSNGVPDHLSVPASEPK